MTWTGASAGLRPMARSDGNSPTITSALTKHANAVFTQTGKNFLLQPVP